MKLQKLFSIALVFVLGNLAAAIAQDSPVEIIQKMDAVVNAPQDQKMAMTMVLIDKDGSEKERKTDMYQKGDETRLVRFLTPADQKSISFLSLPDDVMYLYLPAFRKIRRIASHVKNESFAGTDFSYDDLSSFKYAEQYNPALVETTDEYYVLALVPKPDVQKDYSKLKVWVRKDNYYPVKFEHYDKGGNLWKIMYRRNIEKKGKYWVAMEMEMEDLKTQHRTKAITESIELDTGLSDEIFTQRNLKRVP